MRAYMKYFVLIAVISVSLVPLTWAASGPILYFTFDSASGDVVADESGGGHDGVLKEGAEIITNNKMVGAGALQIEGGTETMEVETFAELEEYNENTYVFWINFTDPASGSWDQIIAKPAPGSDRSPGLWVHTGGLGIHYRYNPGNQGTDRFGPDGENSNFLEDEWYHVAGVKEGGSLIMYINGEEKGTKTVPEEFAQGAEEGMAGLYVGKSQSYGGNGAKFIIDDLAIFDRALSADEVMATMGGVLTAVEATDKLATTWAEIK